MTQLKWTPKPGVLLVEGWPASDHDEPDAKLADAKIASGFYTKADGKGAAPPSASQGEE